MRNTTSTYKEAVRESGREFVPTLTAILADGTSLTLGANDIMQGGFTVEDGVSAPNTLQVGCACMKQLTVVLNNYENAFAGKDFTGAVLTASVGLMLPDGTEETVSFGSFTVDEAVDNGVTITLTALDDMEKLDRPYAESTLQYPATLSQILQDCCSNCGVILGNSRLLNDSYTVAARPDDANLTFRQMVSYVAQLAGCWARMSRGYLMLDWYDYDRFVVEDGLDGNTDTADGLTDNYDGGIFDTPTYGTGSHKVLRPAELDQLQSSTIAAADITVTGVQVIPADDNDTAYLAGKEGYVLSIEGNPLVQGGYDDLAWSLYGKIGPLTFRPCSLSSRGDPSWEAGDVAYVTDRKGIRHRTVISNLTYSIDGWEKISADAETVSRKQSSYSNTTKIVQAARKEVAKKISAYDLQVRYLNDLMSLSMGFYRTEEIAEDGSMVAYLHDKPELSESMTIWKNTIDGFAVSTDGVATWTAGMDSNGNAVVNVLSAKGINADWINAGCIQSQTNPNISINLDSDTIKIQNNAGEGLSIGEDGNAVFSGRIVWGEHDYIEKESDGKTYLVSTDDLIILQLYGSVKIPEGYTQVKWLEASSGIHSSGALSVSGNATIGGELYVNGVQVTSDRAKKTNIQPVDCSALDRVRSLKFYSYDMAESGEESSARVHAASTENASSGYQVAIGIMHDEAPEEIRTHDTSGSKSIDLYAYINLLAKAVQELSAKVETLESQLQSKE